MGYSRKRVGRDGRPRYTAYYWDAKDRERSAGTLPNKKDADRAWQRAEAKVAEGRLGDPGRGRWGELYRRLQLTSQIVAKLQAYVCERGLSNGDLVFAMPERGAVLKMLPNPARLGYTQPNAAGRTYRHGTLSAYTAGRCRCEHCRSAFAQYRRQRRAAGMDDPRTPRVRDTDGHIPRDWFRNQVWRPALAAAGVAAVRPHDLRHAHASWLLAGGADLQAVKERLGHASIATTEKYLNFQELHQAGEKSQVAC